MIKKLILLLLIVCSVSYSQDWYKTHKKKNNGLAQLIANSNTVVWAPSTEATSMTSDSTNLKSTNSSTTTTAWFVGNQLRVFQGFGLANDIATHFEITIKDYTAILFLEVIVGRRNQLTGTFTQIGSTDITALVTSNGQQIFPINIPNVKEGDFVGIKYRTTGNALCIKSGQSNFSTLTKDNADSVNVTFTTTVANSWVPFRIYGRAPMIVFFGDSLPGGSPLHYPYTYFSQIGQIDYTWTTIPHNTCYRYGLTYQNFSFPGETSVKLLSVVSYIIDLHPILVVFENSNDRLSSTANVAIVLQKAIIDLLIAAGIKVIYWEAPPVNSSNSIMFLKDTVKNNVSPYVKNKGGDVVNADPSLGVQRDTGTPAPSIPNLWNIKAGYSPDGAHYHPAPYAEVGRLIDSVLGLRYLIVDTTQIIHAHNPVFDTTEFSPVTIRDTIHSYPGIDSAIIHYSLNGGVYSLFKMTKSDSTSLTNSYNFTGELSINGNDGDLVAYYITGHYKDKVGTSSTKSFNLRVPPSPDLNGLVYYWYAPSLSGTPITSWLNRIDTTTLRQGTTADKPTLLNYATFWDTTAKMYADVPYYNDSMTVDMLMWITDTNSYMSQRIFSWDNGTPDLRIGFIIGLNSNSTHQKFGTYHRNGVNDVNRAFRTSQVSPSTWYNQYARYTLTVDSTNRQKFYINNTQLTTFGAPYSSGTNITNQFGVGNVDPFPSVNGGMKDVRIAVILIYSRIQTSGESSTNQTYHNYVKTWITN